LVDDLYYNEQGNEVMMIKYLNPTSESAQAAPSEQK